MALTKVLTGGLALDAVDNTILKLDDDYALTGTVTGAGGILQVVSTTKTDTFSTTSGTFTDVTGLTAAITPTSATSKVFIIVNFSTSNSGTSSLNVFNLVRDSTNISQPATTPTYNGSFGNYHAVADNIMPTSFTFLDSPETTSATTYKLQMRTNAGTVTINRRNSTDAAFTSTFTLMEIAG